MSAKPREDERKRKTGWYLGLHHIVPSSRGGDNSGGNIYPLERWGEDYSLKHYHWHVLFANLRASEAIDILQSFLSEDGTVKKGFFETAFVVEEKRNGKKNETTIVFKKSSSKYKRRKNAWSAVFGDMTGLEAIEWIHREFVVKAWRLAKHYNKRELQ